MNLLRKSEGTPADVNGERLGALRVESLDKICKKALLGERLCIEQLTIN